jgi:hypothetical protein
MKKALSLLLALVMCLSLCACGGGKQDTQPQKPSSDNTSYDSVSQTEGESLIIQNPESGTPMINIKRFNELMVTVELTTENWMDYIEVCTYTREKVERDAFGEIVSTETVTYHELGAKGDRYYNFRDFVIELKNKTTGELETYKGTNDAWIPGVEEDFRLDEYECTRIKVTIYFVDIPEEAVAPDVDTGMFFFYVGHTDAIYAMYRCTISGSGGRRIGGMFDFMMYN